MERTITFNAITTSSLLCAFFICFILPIKANNNDKAIKLKYLLKSGDEFSYSQKTSMKQSLGDMDMTTSMEAGNDIILRIKEAKENKYKVETNFSSLKLSVSGLAQAGFPDTTLIVDIPESASEPIIVSEDGSIAEEKNQTKEKETGGMVGNMSATALRQSIKQTLKYVFSPLPNHLISIGDEWLRETSEEGTSRDVKINAKWKYKFEGIIDTLGKRCAIITVKTNSLNMEGSITQMGMQMHVEGDGTANGRSIIEIANGMSLTGKVAMQLEMRMAVSGQDQMIMPISMETVNVFTRKMK